jgi:transcriptional regulator with XRE-family HTH domain
MGNNRVIQFPSAASRAMQAGRLLIPSKLRDARKVARLSQGDLANLIGVSRQAVSAYERGDKSPEPTTFQKIAEVLRQPVIFFTGVDREVFGAQSAVPILFAAMKRAECCPNGSSKQQSISIIS